MNRLLLTVLAVMFSQSVMAISDVAPKQDIDQLIATAKSQGYAVAHCQHGLCRNTDDGDYVSISNSFKDGYYVYDPYSAAAPEKFDLNKSHH